MPTVFLKFSMIKKFVQSFICKMRLLWQCLLSQDVGEQTICPFPGVWIKAAIQCLFGD